MRSFVGITLVGFHSDYIFWRTDMLAAMSGPELLGFIIFLGMTVAFFAWIAYLTLSK